jgi:hypothetical protein
VAVIGNGLILAHLSPFPTPIVTGIIILVAIWLNFRSSRRLPDRLIDMSKASMSPITPPQAFVPTGDDRARADSVTAMGITLMHEHIVLDTSSWWHRPCCATSALPSGP